jgi:hypothetical protein
MAVTYATTLKNRRMSAVGAEIDGTNGLGRLELGPAGMGTILVSLTLDFPSVSGSATAGVITFAGFPKTATAQSVGTLGAGRMVTSAGTSVITGLSVSTAGTEIIVDNTSVVTSQLVVVSSITITHG